MNMILCNYEEKEKNIIMAKIGFDLEKYLRLQSERILERVHTFGGKLYLEFGGKLFDDYHASRCSSRTRRRSSSPSTRPTSR